MAFVLWSAPPSTNGLPLLITSAGPHSLARMCRRLDFIGHDQFEVFWRLANFAFPVFTL
jgi:hypothetical protein